MFVARQSIARISVCVRVCIYTRDDSRLNMSTSDAYTRGNLQSEMSYKHTSDSQHTCTSPYRKLKKEKILVNH
jgi:hypothetical protein